MRVLVTGGAGFIGSHVVDQLRVAGVEARIFDRRHSEHHPATEVDTVVGDILCADDLRAAMRGCDAVAHLAAAADVNAVVAEPVAAEELNSRGTVNVLEAARHAGIRRVVYASTVWVYSDAETGEEDGALGLPRHLYTATKLAGEMYCKSYAELYGLDYTILRFGIPYGPRARPAAVVPAFVGKALAGEALTIAGSGEQSRRFVYVEDLARGVVRGLAPQAANRIYNLVGDESVTVREIADTVRDVVGNVEVVNVPGRAGDLGAIEVSGRRAADELDWRSTTPFAEGVRRYVNWHRAQTAEAPPAPVEDRRVRPRVSARRAGIAAIGGSAAVILAVVLAAAAGLQAVADRVDTATTALLFVVPPLTVVSTYDGTRTGWRKLAGMFFALAATELLAVLLPFHDRALTAARAHTMLFLLGALAALTAAVLAATRYRAQRLAVADSRGD